MIDNIAPKNAFCCVQQFHTANLSAESLATLSGGYLAAKVPVRSTQWYQTTLLEMAVA